MTLDAYASLPHYASHILPVWLALPREIRGHFYGPQHEQAWGPQYQPGNRCLVASRVDAQKVVGRYIYLEHGAGQSYGGDPFSARNSSYAGGYDRSLERADLFIGPGHRVVERWAEVSEAPAVAVGCPYLDWWHSPRTQLRRHFPGWTVAFTFHWSAENVCQEAWPALDHYETALQGVVNDLKRSGVSVLGHGHPRTAGRLKRMWRSMGVPWVCREQVFAHADVVVADNTSLGWEAASLGVRLVWLNAPWYRKDVEHGLRFWQWAGSGLQVDEPGDLVDAIRTQLAGDAAPSREEAVADIYAACDGHASERAAAAIRTVIGD